MRKNFNSMLSFFLFSLFASQALSAEEMCIDQEAFIKAVPLDRKAPKYPYARARKAQEGVVDIGMMVSKEGNVYSPIVNMSTHTDFEESAIEAVNQYKFIPATFNGGAVDSYYDIRVFYSMARASDVVSERFAKFYKTAKKELAKDQPNQKKLERKIESMNKVHGMTHYSLAHLAVIRAQTAAKFGDEQSQLEALKQLLIFEDTIGEKGKLLDDGRLALTKSAVVSVQLHLNQLQEARWSYLGLQEFDLQNAKKFDEVMIEVNKILSSGTPFSQQLDLGSRAYQEVSLAATKFDIQDIAGDIQKLTFRCQKGFFEMTYQVNSEYQVPSKWGRCKMQVSGSPNSTASLIQFK